MVRFFVTDTSLPCSTGPPRRSLRGTFGVRIMRLLLRLDQLDESFTHDLTRRLLHVFESNIVKLIDLFLVAYRQLLGSDNGYRGIIFELWAMTLS